ncbi:nucleoid occlusion protein [Mangrovibacillus cuniculi]|uniref:Nucleoid occlusion protein n=1 Tax=Mangrovibacillus cuniculi TaxID=2593652 RepID=A0A7S8CDD0_9BACI|nr:nucleoid occlusion protein [Mangrovibacillus cuniculi]QPC47925.1 nucleoid occlusion protein [Mangrovibacillus cuniculi]
MKSPFSRLFGVSEKEEPVQENTQEVEQTEPIEVVEVERDEVHQIPIHQIVPNRHQPRTVFQESKIAELAETISQHGIIQPIVLQKIAEDQYELIAGERRWRAVQMLQWERVPAILRTMSEEEMASVALIENLQREELSPIEEAFAYEKLLKFHGLTQEALAQRLGKGQSTIANKLRLLKLPKEVQDAVLQKFVTERHARALIPLKKPDLQIALLADIIEKSFNVKQTEDRVSKMLEKNPEPSKARRKAFSKDMRIAVNTIRQSLTMVTDSGINLDAAEEEFDEYYQFTIKIPKKKS